MVKFKVKANPTGQYYFPKEVRQELGGNLELISNARAAVIYPEGTPIKTILDSLQIIQTDLKHREQLQKEERHDTP